MNSHRTCPAGAQSPISDRRHAIIEALARQREAWEMACAATKETALAPSSNDSLIATTSNPTASIFLRQCKYSATRLTKARSIGASIVQVRVPDIDSSTWTWCGVIEDIVELAYGEHQVVLAHMMWLSPWTGELLDDWKE